MHPCRLNAGFSHPPADVAPLFLAMDAAGIAGEWRRCKAMMSLLSRWEGSAEEHARMIQLFLSVYVLLTEEELVVWVTEQEARLWRGRKVVE